MKLELTPVVQYWELNFREILSRLGELRQAGATSVAAWVPWSHLETDRHGQLQKFCKQALLLGFKVRLGITPELNTGFLNGGVPEELLKDRQNLALDRSGQIIFSCSPPNIHPLVSLSAPKVIQKYGHFLLKLSQDLSEILTEGFVGQLELVVTDSLFKHYSITGLSADDHGDYSGRYLIGDGSRQLALTPAQAEKYFVSRTSDFLRAKFSRVPQLHVTTQNIFSRSTSLDRLMEELMQSGVNRKQFFEQMSQSSVMNSMVWLDNLKDLTDREKYFLISSSLILNEDVWIHSEDYLLASAGIRKKLQHWIEELNGDDLGLSQPVFILVQNRFAPTRISKMIHEKIKGGVRFGSNGALEIETAKKSKLIVVEEGMLLEFSQYEDLEKLVSANNITLAVFRSSLCLRAEKRLSELRTFQLNNAWNYDVCIFPSGGHFLVIDGNENQNTSMDSLIDSLIAVAQIKPWCECASEKVLVKSFEWNEHNKLVFLINPEPDFQEISLHFARNAKIQEAYGKSFDTKLPPFSVIPVALTLDETDTKIINKKIEQHKELENNGTEALMA